MTTFDLECPTGFSLAATAQFYAGFAPMGGAASATTSSLTLAFLLDGTFETTFVTLTQTGRRLAAESTSFDRARVVAQLTRMMGLDADGDSWVEVGRRDPVIGALQGRSRGFFTAGFPSPFEAGVSGVLSHRSSIAQAARVRRALAEAHGVTRGGVAVMPSPTRLLEVRGFPGISERKLSVLHGLARAALDGTLDATRLNALPPEFALGQLEQLDGVGPWTAAHLLVRGASARDVLPTAEPRVRQAFVAGSGRPAEDFEVAARAWAPFRTWASILLVRAFGFGAARPSVRAPSPSRQEQRARF